MSARDLFDLKGKVSLVSGGGDGIGRAMAIALADAGSDVVIFSRRAEKCEAVAHEIESQGGRALALACDILRGEEIERVVSETLRVFGKIDVLVNNSGRTWGDAPEDITLENWKKVIDLNLNATFLCTQLVGREMIKRQQGKIINISSYSGSRGTDPAYLDAIPYNTTKGAVNIFTQDLAVKWAKYNITVNAIAPGWFPTRMTQWTFDNRGEAILARIPLKRYGTMEELMGVIVFMASPASNYITGQIIAVDGGLTAW
ncbi:MAG: glucose 1-dehydrogenase [Desulfobacteraceae bacterium]|jgi:gluconate 5-dehydrogenase|nr:glucose 1-dehydrogenase [Desulfobacteraceae bacterium]